MPVKKTSSLFGTTRTSSSSDLPVGMHKCCHAKSGGMKILFVLIGILVAYSIVFLGTLIRNNIKKFDAIGIADKNERTIVVEGQGKVTATPDIAMVSLGMLSEGKTVAETQQKNTEVMNKLTAKLKGLKIDQKDIQTTYYNIYPKYDYADNSQKLVGYQVSQNVTVKIRDVAIANQVIAVAGEVGANNVGGLQFTIDDRDAFKSQARDLALKKVGEKAKALSQALGVNLIGVVSYNEYEGGSGNEMYGVGGMGISTKAMDAPIAPPDLQTGSNDVVMNVNVVFEIR